MNNMFFSGLIVYDYNKEYTELILKELINLKMNINLSLFYEKQDTYKTIKDLTYFIGNIGVDLSNNQNNEDIEIASFSYNDAKYIRKEMQINNQELYYMYLYILVYSLKPEETNYFVEKVESILESNGILCKRANFRQEQLFLSCCPIFENNIDIKNVARRNFLTNSILSTYPFMSNSIVDKNGIYIGNNVYDDSMIFINRFDSFKYKNANMCIFGCSGAGKSFFTKLMIIRSRIMGINQYVIDPEREYDKIATKLDGTLVKIGPNAKTYINILDIREESLEDDENGYLITKLNKLKGFFKLIIGTLNDEKWVILERALIKTYNEKGIYFDDDSLYKNSDKFSLKSSFKSYKEMPKLSDLYNNIESEEIRLKLYPFVYGSLSFFNEYTNVNLENKLIIADIYELGDENIKYGMYVFTDIFWDKVKKDRKLKKAIYLDEIWRMIGTTSNKEVASFIYRIFKTIRKYNGSAVSITQDVSDLFSLEDGIYGRCILNNSEIKSLFHLEEENILFLEKYFNLSEKEKIEVKNLDRGENLMWIKDNHLLIKIIASDFEKEIVMKENENKKDNNCIR